MTVFFFFCGTMQNLVARHCVFEQPPSWRRAALTPQATRCRPPCSACRTFVLNIRLFRLFLNPLHCPHIYIQTLWNILIGTSCEKAKQYSMAFLHFLCRELHYGALFLTDGSQASLPYRAAYKIKFKKNKQRACVNIKWGQFIHRMLYLQKECPFRLDIRPRSKELGT